jgi:hypothetical protein
MRPTCYQEVAQLRGWSKGIGYFIGQTTAAAAARWRCKSKSKQTINLPGKDSCAWTFAMIAFPNTVSCPTNEAKEEHFHDRFIKKSLAAV